MRNKQLRLCHLCQMYSMNSNTFCLKTLTFWIIHFIYNNLENIPLMENSFQLKVDSEISNELIKNRKLISSWWIMQISIFLKADFSNSISSILRIAIIYKLQSFCYCEIKISSIIVKIIILFIQSWSYEFIFMCY